MILYSGLNRFKAWRIVAPLLAAAAAALTGMRAAAAAPPSYQKDVLPILRTACLGCHSADSAAGSLSVSSYASLIKGGSHGAPIVPGKSAESRLYKMITGALQPKMPPGAGLKQADIDHIKAWIDAGAKIDSEAVASKTPGKTAPGAAAAAITPVKTYGKTIAAAPPVTALAYSPDGVTLAVGSYRTVRFWDVKQKRYAGEWSGHADAVRSLAYSKDGRLLAAGGGVPGATGEIRLWDTAAAREISRFGDNTDVVNCVAFSPNGKRIAAGSADKSVRIWDIDGAKPNQPMREHSDAVLGVAWSPDGKYIASCSADWSVKVWDAASGRRLYSVGAHDGPVNWIGFCRDGESLFTVSSDKSAKVWNFGADNSTAARAISSHEGYVLAGAVSADGKLGVTGSSDKTVKICRLDDGTILATLKGASDWIYAVSISPDGATAAAGCWDGSVLTWSVATSKLGDRFSTLK